MILSNLRSGFLLFPFLIHKWYISLFLLSQKYNRNIPHVCMCALAALDMNVMAHFPLCRAHLHCGSEHKVRHVARESWSMWGRAGMVRVDSAPFGLFFNQRLFVNIQELGLALFTGIQMHKHIRKHVHTEHPISCFLVQVLCLYHGDKTLHKNVHHTKLLCKYWKQKYL